MLDIKDVLLAMVMASLFTWLYLRLEHAFKSMVSRPLEFNYSQEDITQIINRCERLFPMGDMQFHGVTIKKGMKIRIVTIQRKTYEGEFIGCNNQNTVCVLTKHFITAQTMDNIMEIEELL